MNLKFASVAAVIAMTAVSLAPAVSFAATAKTTATTTASAMTSTKPAKTTTPDPKRFKTEADAAKSCPADTVVWANISSKIFHLKGTATYGKTKNGAYMCEADATAEGFKGTKKPEKITS